MLITGIGTLICLFMPSIVVIGLFLIVPGLILSVMPTAFLWGGVFAAIWFPLQGAIGRVAATAVAMLATVALLYAAPMPSRAVSRARLALAVRPDVLPVRRLTIVGDVRIDLPSLTTEPFDPANPGAVRPVRCNALCAATLFTPGVASVTLNPNDRRDATERSAIGDAPLSPSARTFRRVPRAGCGETLRPTDAAGLGGDLDGVRALQAEWNLRLSTSDCIVAVPTRRAPDLVIAQGSYTVFGDRVHGYDWSLDARPVGVERIEIRRTDGTVLLRLLIAKTEALTLPLLIGAGGGLESFHFGWNRSTVSNAARYASLDVAQLLKAHTDLALSADPVATARLARERLRAMIDDPAIRTDDTGWSAAEGYFGQLRKAGIGDADRRLLPALIRDRRMTRFDGIWDAIRALGEEGTILRDALVDRLAAPGPDDEPDVARILGRAIGSLPHGTFSHPSPAELALLADPAARRRVPGLIARQADRGAAAVPLLLAIIDQNGRAWAAIRASRRSGPVDNSDDVAVDAARVAFCLLGPAAAPALPRLLALDRAGLIPRVLSGEREWTFALARMGRPVESFAKPDSLSGTTDQFHANLRRRLAGFRADRDCGATFG